MYFNWFAGALLSAIFILTPSIVYSADSCRAIFDKHVDPLEKSMYFDGVLETDHRLSRKNRWELTDLRTEFRRAYDYQLATANSSRFSLRNIWARRQAKQIRIDALEKSQLVKDFLVHALELHRQNNLSISNYSRTIKVLLTHNRKTIELDLGAQRIENRQDERLFVESELLRTLREVERTENYYNYVAPTPQQLARFNQNVASMERSDRVYLLRRGTEQSLDELILGKSYLAIVANGKLVLGEGYRNGAGTTSNTHNQLRDDVSVGMGLGGAVRFNIDGTIDVSGYHSKTTSPEAARAMFEILRSTLPSDVQIRSTPGRLTDLP